MRGKGAVLACAAVLLAACGGGSGDPSSTEASGEVTDFDWPTTSTAVEEMMARMPTEVGGLVRTADPESDEFSEFDEDSESWMVEYAPEGGGSGLISTGVGVFHEERSLRALAGMWAWAGCDVGCEDVSASPVLQPLVMAKGQKAQEREMKRLRGADADDDVWLRMTSTYDIVNGQELPSYNWYYILVWSSGDFVFGIEAHSSEDRAALLEALQGAVE